MERGIEILKRFEEQEWTTKDGTKIKIKDLSLSHLGNIYRHLKKQYKSIEDPINDFPSFQGEMAQMEADNQFKSAIKAYEAMKRRFKIFEVYYKLKSL